uniref:Uncharacterized protein n=1 Tax=Anguilla anguilla TaxID=7936 RepID=A0A0E9WEL3_ANGAN
MLRFQVSSSCDVFFQVLHFIALSSVLIMSCQVSLSVHHSMLHHADLI